MDPLAPYRGRDLDERAYLSAIEGLELDGVNWSAATLAEMRDFLAPWHHNIRLPGGIHTAYWERLYGPHEEMMSIVAHALRGEFAGKATSPSNALFRGQPWLGSRERSRTSRNVSSSGPPWASITRS